MANPFNRTKICWCDYSWNPGTGCLHECRYCYARRRAVRFAAGEFPIEFHEDRLNIPRTQRARSIFIGSNGDTFCDHPVPAGGDAAIVLDEHRQQIKKILDAIIKANKRSANAVFSHVNDWIFLTKNPVKYLQFRELFKAISLSDEHVFLGCTIDFGAISKAPPIANRLTAMKEVVEEFKGHAFISFEPLYPGHVLEIKQALDATSPDAVIIGIETPFQDWRSPGPEEIAELSRLFHDAGTVAWFKNNIIDNYPGIKQTLQKQLIWKQPEPKTKPKVK